jgi:hypothetical protein
MKIAVLYSGTLRNLAETINNNIDCFRSISNNIDLYFSIWDHVGYVDHLNAPDYIKSNRLINKNEIVTLKLIEEIIPLNVNVKHIKIEKYLDKQFNFELINGLDNNGLKAQYYKIFDCLSLVEENYDLMIRMRCDILIDKMPEIKIDKISFFSRIWHNHYWQPGFRSINEMFWVAPPEMMKKACNIYNNCEKINRVIIDKNQQDTNYGESICYMNLEAEEMVNNIQMLDIDYKVLR